MSYAIVYSSRTGNTALLAKTIREILGEETCVYFGPPAPQAFAAETIYAGFWTDRGTCDEEMAQFLQSLTDQSVFLFGTAGFGGAPAYYDQILERVQANLKGSVRLLGRYMCQGQMPQAVRTHYEGMEDSPRRTAMLENFDRALGHPDAGDLEQLRRVVEK